MTTKQIEVSILGQPYRLACSPETEGALREAIARVDAEMNKVRNASSVRGTDRIAVMAALSLASETQRNADRSSSTQAIDSFRKQAGADRCAGLRLQQFHDSGSERGPRRHAAAPRHDDAVTCDERRCEDGRAHRDGSRSHRP